MELKEANKIIAEYMGLEYPAKSDAGYFRPNLSFVSLDALVPVWEKLEIYEHLALSFNPIEVFVWQEGNYTCGWHSFNSTGKTIQEAACLATAKAIKEFIGE